MSLEADLFDSGGVVVNLPQTFWGWMISMRTFPFLVYFGFFTALLAITYNFLSLLRIRDKAIRIEAAKYRKQKKFAKEEDGHFEYTSSVTSSFMEAWLDVAGMISVEYEKPTHQGNKGALSKQAHPSRNEDTPADERPYNRRRPGSMYSAEFDLSPEAFLRAIGEDPVNLERIKIFREFQTTCLDQQAAHHREMKAGLDRFSASLDLKAASLKKRLP